MAVIFKKWRTRGGQNRAQDFFEDCRSGARGCFLECCSGAVPKLEGNFPNPVIAANLWLTTGGGYVAQPDYKDRRSVEWNLQVQQQLTPTALLQPWLCWFQEHTRLKYAGFANTANHASPAGTPHLRRFLSHEVSVAPEPPCSHSETPRVSVSQAPRRQMTPKSRAPPAKLSEGRHPTL
jgi:hypothetical protein